MKYRAYVYLGLYGDYDPIEVAAGISLTPDKSVAKHSTNPEGRIPRTSILRYGYAEMQSELIDVYDLSERTVSLLRPHIPDIMSAIKRYSIDASLQVVIDFPVSDDVSTPALGLSEDVVAVVSQLGASVDFDTYRA